MYNRVMFWFIVVSCVVLWSISVHAQEYPEITPQEWVDFEANEALVLLQDQLEWEEWDKENEGLVTQPTDVVVNPFNKEN